MPYGVLNNPKTIDIFISIVQVGNKFRKAGWNVSGHIWSDRAGIWTQGYLISKPMVLTLIVYFNFRTSDPTLGNVT